MLRAGPDAGVVYASTALGTSIPIWRMTVESKAVKSTYFQSEILSGVRVFSVIRSKRAFLLLVVLMMLFGCAAPPLVPPETSIRAIDKIRVVGMEMPPLEVTGLSKKMASAALEAPPKTSSTPSIPAPYPYPPGQTPLKGAQISGVATVIGAMSDMTSEHPELDPYLARLSVAATELLIPGRAWDPAHALVEETSSLLAEGGWMTSQSAYLQALPSVENRAVTKYMLNWQMPINDWYNDERVSYTYEDHGVGGTEKILEVSGYLSFYQQYFILSVRLKLVDPKSRKTLGRVRDDVMHSLTSDKIDELVSDGGIAFEKLFRSNARTLIKSCLHQLGLENEYSKSNRGAR